MATDRASIHFPPKYPDINRPSVVLFGTIEKDPINNWASSLSTSLSDLEIQILNPRRDDWDHTWKEDISFAPFRENVEWEMAHAEKADVIVLCFRAGSECHITLLELGMHAARYGERIVVCCEEGFHKRGNVEIVCGKFKAACVKTRDELHKVVRQRMVELCTAKCQ